MNMQRVKAFLSRLLIHKRYGLIGAVVIIGAVLITVWLNRATIVPPQAEPIYIAFAAPTEGLISEIGNIMREAVELYFEEVNVQGGVNGRPLVLDVSETYNTLETGEARAQEIVAQNRALGVIGHLASSNSIKGGEHYKALGLPAISPTSTNDQLTIDNEWYFRTVFNDGLQGQFLANYAVRVSHPPEPVSFDADAQSTATQAPAPQPRQINTID